MKMCNPPEGISLRERKKKDEEFRQIFSPVSEKLQMTESLKGKRNLRDKISKKRDSKTTKTMKNGGAQEREGGSPWALCAGPTDGKLAMGGGSTRQEGRWGVPEKLAGPAERTSTFTAKGVTQVLCGLPAEPQSVPFPKPSFLGPGPSASLELLPGPPEDPVPTVSATLTCKAPEGCRGKNKPSLSVLDCRQCCPCLWMMPQDSGPQINLVLIFPPVEGALARCLSIFFK